mmetsp:Transcript_49685/g.111666  ORF Transcript_49685/g.111666 Transcript_49685/m.111666 type:complete len:204 (+) Transcript_49685:82-693(+)
MTAASRSRGQALLLAGAAAYYGLTSTAFTVAAPPAAVERQAGAGAAVAGSTAGFAEQPVTRTAAAGAAAAAAALAVGAAALRSRGRRSGAVQRQGVEEDFEGGVNTAKVVVFTRALCQKSEMAKEALDDMKIRYNVMELENEVGLDSIGPAGDFKDYMEQKTGTAELPQVHIRGGKGIGGLDAIFEKQDSGELLEWCKAAGAA